MAAHDHVADAQLIDITWQWERRDPNGAPVDPITVPNPEAYTLLFSADGAFNAQVDCNSAAGQYATASPDAIYMELGPMTMAACPPESLSDAMMLMFGVPQTYRLEENGSVLVLAGADGGPLDYFRNAAVPAAGEAEIEAIPAETIQMNLQGLANSLAGWSSPAARWSKAPVPGHAAAHRVNV
ncbi:MAG: META domain-containing protein [Chloroflexi bacterium]|nr:META domain-containing protein [Chloroflexota bacterium]